MKAKDLSRLLRVTRRVFKILREQEMKGWLLDQTMAVDLLSVLESRGNGLELQLRPNLPKVLVPKSRRKAWPKIQFKKDGTPTVQAKKYYGEDHSVYRTDRPHDYEPLNLRNPQQVSDFLLSVGWKPTEWNYKRDQEGNKVRSSPKLTEDSFDSIEGEVGQQIAELRKIWSRSADIKRYLANLRPDGRVPTPFSGKTVTHRLRHSIVVNVPGVEAYFGREQRSLFIAPPGRSVVGCDSDSCQLRMLVHEMHNYGLHNEEFSHALLYGSKDDGTDAHSLNTSRVNALLGRELLNRQATKTVFYATIFGGGVGRLQTILGTTRAEAQAVMEAFYEVLPELPELKERLNTCRKNYGFVPALDGRPIYIRSPHMAVVSLMQGDEAVAMEYSMCYAYDKIRKEELDAFQLMYYHDEFEYEASNQDAQRVGEILEESIAWPAKQLGLHIPLTGTASIGASWAEVH